MQLGLFEEIKTAARTAPNGQLLKWIGNKQRYAEEIVRSFPENFNRYHEPFLGSGAVLATLWPASATASDTFKPLVDIWLALKNDPDRIKEWYTTRWEQYNAGDPREEYERIKALHLFTTKWSRPALPV